MIKKINHSILSDRGYQILYHARRYVCPVCGRTYYEVNPFVSKRMKISSWVVLSVMKDLRRPIETFTSVAQRYHIPTTTAAALFDHTVSIPRGRLPKILSIDENYAFFSREQRDAYYLLKHQNKLLFKQFRRSLGKDKKPLFDIHRKRIYNQHFQKYVNPYDMARELMNIHPDIRIAWDSGMRSLTFMTCVQERQPRNPWTG